MNIPKHAQEVVRLNLDGEVDVYTLSLEDHHVYIANSVLVGNCWIMRMYFEIKEQMSPQSSPEMERVFDTQNSQFMQNRGNEDSSR